MVSYRGGKEKSSMYIWLQGGEGKGHVLNIPGMMPIVWANVVARYYLILQKKKKKKKGRKKKQKELTDFYPYSSLLLDWHWGNHRIAPVPVK